MSWIAFAFLSAMLATGAALAQKKTLIKEHAMEYSTIMAIFAAILSLPLLAKADFSLLTPTSFLLIFTNSVLAAIAYLLVSKSVRHMPISTVSPLLVFGPGITAIVAWLILGESLSAFQIGGLGFLIVGMYILETKNKQDLLHPFRKVFKSKYFKYVFIALLIYAITSTIDKKIMGNAAEGGLGFNAATYLGIIHMLIAINYVILITFFHEGFDDIKHGVKNMGGWILLVALLTVGYRMAQQHALTFIGSKVSLVTAIKKTSALMTTIIGGELFHENNLLQKTIACVVMVAGAIMIIT